MFCFKKIASSLLLLMASMLSSANQNVSICPFQLRLNGWMIRSETDIEKENQIVKDYKIVFMT